MGYYTQYSLTMSGNEEQIRDLITNDYAFSDVSDDTLSGVLDQPCKWYDHDNDMLELSSKYPGVKFYLYGDGEDDEDYWVKVYKNGKTSAHGGRVKIIYNGFRKPSGKTAYMPGSSFREYIGEVGVSEYLDEKFSDE